MADDETRRADVKRRCTRMLSGTRPLSMGEQLTAFTRDADLDAPPDRYGDGVVTAVEDRVAALLGTQAAVFLPTGTMAQQIALRYGAERTGSPTVAMHPQGHLEVYERHAYAALTGLRSVWPTTLPRNPTAAEVEAVGEPFGTLLLELPLRDAGFVLPSWDDLVAVTAAARARGARVHLDGARLWESVPFLGQPLDAIAALADSVYVSFYKSLGGLSGAALAGTADLIAYARAWRHRYGGQIFQQWPAALSALAGLDTELPRLPQYVAHARVVAEALAALPGVRLHPVVPHTHQFQIWLPYPADVLDEAALHLGADELVWFIGGWRPSPAPGVSVAEVTVADPATAWTADDVTQAGASFLARAQALAGL